MRATWRALAVAGVFGLVGCGSSTGESGEGASAAPDAGPAATSDASVDVSPDAAEEEAAAAPVFTSCKDDPPPGTTLPTLPTYAGTCPALVQAPTENTIESSGNQRQFLLVAPSDVKPGEKLPVVFLWHWLKGSGQDFVDRAEIVEAVEQQRFIAVAPEMKKDLFFDWPFNLTDSDARLQEEFRFFDDMLACVAAQYPQVNAGCIASAGVSAGALFTAQLGPARADVLASILVLSGGVGGVVRPWSTPSRALPALVLWGGPQDHCVVDFTQTTSSLEDALDAEGSFYVECQHNCGHSEPPFEAPAGESRYAAFWEFVYAHPFWLAPGTSPFEADGLPPAFPSWCSIGGKGSAMPREGACGEPGCPI